MFFCRAARYACIKESQNKLQQHTDLLWRVPAVFICSFFCDAEENTKFFRSNCSAGEGFLNRPSAKEPAFLCSILCTASYFSCSIPLTRFSVCFSLALAEGPLFLFSFLPALWYSILSIANCLMQFEIKKCMYRGYSNAAYIPPWLEIATGLSGWETDVLWITCSLPKELKPNCRAGRRSWLAVLVVQ